MDILESIRVLALYNTLKFDEGGGDSDYSLRRVFRWYSKTFFTPLHVVERLELEHVLTAWWEEKYQEMEPEDLERERKAMVQDPEELRKQQMAEDAQDAEAAMDAAQIAREEAEDEARAKKNQLNTAALAPATAFRSSIAKDSELIMGPTMVAKPEITMRFSDEDFDLDQPAIGLMTKPRPKPR